MQAPQHLHRFRHPFRYSHPPLLPVLQAAHRAPELCGKLGLGEVELVAGVFEFGGCHAFSPLPGIRPARARCKNSQPLWLPSEQGWRDQTRSSILICPLTRGATRRLPAVHTRCTAAPRRGHTRVKGRHPGNGSTSSCRRPRGKETLEVATCRRITGGN